MTINKTFFKFIISTLIAFVSTLALVLVFAFIVKEISLSQTVIRIINQIIKAISLFLAVLFFGKREKGAIYGALIGLLYFAICFATVCVFEKAFCFGVKEIIDLLLCLVLGLVFGTIRSLIERR